MPKNKLFTDGNQCLREENFMNTSLIQLENPSNLLKYLRRTQDFQSTIHDKNLQFKEPHLLLNPDRISALKRLSTDGIIQDPIKQIEIIKNKHSKKFKNSHFTMKRIGLNPKSYCSIISKKPLNNSIDSIKEYVDRNNIGTHCDITIKNYLRFHQNQYFNNELKDQFRSSDQSSPFQNNILKSINIKEINQKKLQNNIIDLEYNIQMQEKLNEIFNQKKKERQKQEISQIKQTQISNQKDKSIEYGSKNNDIDTNSNIQSNQLPPQKLNLQIRNNTSIQSPKNEQQKREKQKQLYPNQEENILKNQGDNQQNIIQINRQYYKSKSPQLQKPLQPKMSYQRHHSQHDSVTNNKKIEIEDDYVFKQILRSNMQENKNRSSQGDMNQNLNDTLFNKNINLHQLQHTSPVNNSTQIYKNKRFSTVNNAFPLEEIPFNIQESNQEQEKKTQNKEVYQNSLITNNDYFKINILGENNHNLNNKTCLSSLQNNNGSIKNELSKYNQTYINLPNKKNNSIDQFSNIQQGKLNSLDQYNTGNNSVLLSSMCDYEEETDILQQIEVDKQQKAKKYLKKLGLNNRYSRKENMKQYNKSSISQEFLDIDFEKEQVKQRQRVQSISYTQNPLQISKKKDYRINHSSLDNQIPTINISQELSKNSKDCTQIAQSKLSQPYKQEQQLHQKREKRINSKDQLILPEVKKSNSPDLSKNIDILQQCEKEIKNINYLNKKWERNICKNAKECKKYDQIFIKHQNQNKYIDNLQIFQCYQDQNINMFI